MTTHAALDRFRIFDARPFRDWMMRPKVEAPSPPALPPSEVERDTPATAAPAWERTLLQILGERPTGSIEQAYRQKEAGVAAVFAELPVDVLDAIQHRLDAADPEDPLVTQFQLLAVHRRQRLLSLLASRRRARMHARCAGGAP